MQTKPTGKEAEVLRLRREGVTEREIMKRTGFKKSKVHDLCVKAGIAPAPKNRKGADRVAVAKKPAAGVLKSPKGSKQDPLPPAEEKQVFDDHGNEAEAELVTHDVKTLDDLLEVCKVDLTVWSVERYVTNKWACAMKDNAGEAKTIPLYQVKAWLVRKVALANPEMPDIQPIRIQLKTKATAFVRRVSDQIKRAIVVPDIQCGFKRDMLTGKFDPLHNRFAMDIVLQIVEDTKPDRIIFCGDNLDLPDYSSKFLCSPEFKGSTQAAIVELAWYYAQFRRICPHAQIEVIEGNHDRRFTTTLISRMEMAYGLRPANDLGGSPLISMERLLGLEDLNITYLGPYPLGCTWINENLRVHHGEVVRAGSGKTVAKIAEDLRASEITGHLHREESASKTFWSKDGPKTYQAVSVGTLARIDPGIVPSNSSHNNWQNAFGNVFYEEGNGFYNINGVLIFKDLAIFEGRRYNARSEAEIVANIQSDTGYDMKAI